MRSARRPAIPMLATLIALAPPSAILAGCAHRSAADDYAHRACMDRCEVRNHTCVIEATTAAALDGCSREVSWCVQSCR